MTDFLSLGISAPLAKALKIQGVTQATPIQEKAIPIALGGRDVIGQAQTGTGKTFAFVLPILEQINPASSAIQALIVAPTRELALQITEEFERICHAVNISGILAVYGGQDIDKQLKKLAGSVQVVVGTPGRILDHIRRGTIDLSSVSVLVLDEADQMLHIGFLDEVEQIISHTPAKRQTMLFSATMPEEVRKLAGRYLNEAAWLQAEKAQTPANTVRQISVETTDRGKKSLLIQLIHEHRPFLAVVFCRTKRRVAKLAGELKEAGLLSDELHGDLSQSKRERVMERFRKADIQVLVATDVAARGLDVEGITHVFNYDIPLDPESFIHRIGRTGRAGMKGVAITFFTSRERELLHSIERNLGISAKRISDPHLKKNEEDGKKKADTRKPARRDYEKKTRNGRSSGAGQSQGQAYKESGNGKPAGRHSDNKPGAGPKRGRQRHTNSKKR